MPTTRYVDENLSFYPQQWTPQWNQNSAYFQEMFSSVPPGMASSNSESESSAPESFPETSNSPIRSPDTTTGDAKADPYLELVEGPVESCRFRYPTEMKGTHGSILGISTKIENAKKKTYPTVKLNNFHPTTSADRNIIIRCILTTADKDIHSRVPHVHLLKGKGVTSTSQGKTVDVDDPIDVTVSASSNYIATFPNLSILYIKKDDQFRELVEKKKRHLEQMHPNKKVIFHKSELIEFQEAARKEVAEMNTIRLNTACLKFEAWVTNQSGQLRPVCAPIFSKPIKNIKNAQFNDLRICRIDRVTGSCLGRDEVFIFVEKVNKKDIKIRFFEVNKYEMEIWHEYAEFGEDDVHYQYGIAFRTPRYKSVDITENVEVYFHLERQSDGNRSERKTFTYLPNPKRWQDEIRKRPRLESPPIPAPVQDLFRPSTSSSNTSTWNSHSTVDPPLSSSSSAGPMELGTEDSWTDSFSDLLKDFEMNFPTSPFNEIDGDQDKTTSITSVNEALSSFPSVDSERLLQMIKIPGTLQKLGQCYGMEENLIEKISAEVTTLEDLKQLGAQEEFVPDGPCNWSNKSQKGDIVCQIDAGKDDQVTKFEMQRSSSRNQDIALHQSGLELPEVLKHKKRLTRDNIVSKVARVVAGLINLMNMKKLSERNMKEYILGIFATCIDKNEDRVLHVLASNPVFPKEILTFLNVLTMYDIAQPVVNLKNIRGQTTLHLAAENGSLQTIALLVERGADVNAKDIKLNTPIHLVAKREQNDAFHAVGHILDKNPDLLIYNEDGLTALHLFVLKRKSDVISSLIVKSEDKSVPVDLINQRDRKQGNTALHMAVQMRFLEIVNLLLNFEDRIDVNIKNFEGKTPLAYVTGSTIDERKIEDLLISNNADPSMVSRNNKMSEELKTEVDSDSILDDGTEEDADESLPSFAQEWRSDAELQLLDRHTVCSMCPILDENKNWAKLLKKLDFDEDIFHILDQKWSPTLYLLKTVAETKPNITSEILRDTLMRINPECKIAAQFIDDMILCNMGVF